MSPFGGHHRRRSSGGVVGNSERSGELSTTPPLKLKVRSRFMVGQERFLPGMIGAGDVMGTRRIDLFAVDDFGLTFLAVKNSIGQNFALVEESDLSLGIQTDGDGGVAQGIAGTWGLDLIHHFLKLHGQVLGEQTRFLPGQDLIERIAGGEGTVCVMVTAWGYRETLIEVPDKFWQIRIACFPRRDAAQTQLLWQAIWSV